jgi:hypothetical protein
MKSFRKLHLKRLFKQSSADRPKIELSEFERSQLGSDNDGRKPYISEENWPEFRQHLLDKKTKGYGDKDFILNPDLVAYTPGETVGLLSQPEVIEWHEKMRNYRIPEEYKTIALVPCASTKPWGHGRCNTSEYYKAYNKIREQVESGELDDSVFFVTVSEPLGVVPEDMWNDFPAYDNPGLFKDDYLRTGMVAKKWEEKYDRSYKLPFGGESYDSSINTLSAIIDTFVRNNRLEGRRFISFVDYRPGSSMKMSTHSDMLNRVEEGFEESPFDRRYKSEYARQKMEDKEDGRGLHSYMVESLSDKESSRLDRLNQIFKISEEMDVNNVRPNDIITVFHGTSLADCYEMINGFDANKIMPRLYNGPRHAGIFVSPTEEVANKFASYGEIILEIDVRAKFLHGVDYSGNIGRKSDPHAHSVDWHNAEMEARSEMAGKKFPDSFRPHLSLTWTQGNEPQALLRGLVSPRQIRRVRHKEYGNDPVWYSREEFLKLGLKVVPRKDQPYGSERGLSDVGYDLSKPNYSDEEFTDMVAKINNVPPEKVTEMISFYSQLRRDHPDRSNMLLEEFSRSGVGETASKIYSERYAALKMLNQIFKLAVPRDGGPPVEPSGNSGGLLDIRIS